MAAQHANFYDDVLGVRKTRVNRLVFGFRFLDNQRFDCHVMPCLLKKLLQL
jgi:hypothetical protein